MQACLLPALTHLTRLTSKRHQQLTLPRSLSCSTCTMKTDRKERERERRKDTRSELEVVRERGLPTPEQNPSLHFPRRPADSSKGCGNCCASSAPLPGVQPTCSFQCYRFAYFPLPRRIYWKIIYVSCI